MKVSFRFQNDRWDYFSLWSRGSLKISSVRILYRYRRNVRFPTRGGKCQHACQKKKPIRFDRKSDTNCIVIITDGKKIAFNFLERYYYVTVYGCRHIHIVLTKHTNAAITICKGPVANLSPRSLPHGCRQWVTEKFSERTELTKVF